MVLLVIRIETISWSPRAFIYHNFLSEAECDHLTDIGNKRVSRSLVVDSKTGQSKLDDIRTSYGAAFGRGEDPVIAAVEERIAEWTHLPPEYGEPMQILRYVDGQKYDAHWDWFDDPVHHAAYLHEGNRYATVLLYLSGVEGGGETNLPLADPIDKEAQGMKWTATKWIHNKPYMGKYDPLRTAGRCADTGGNCAARAAAGECTSNMDKMVGPAGECRKSCNDCVDCPAGDILCARRNMRSLVRTRAAAAAAAASRSSS
eukprot:XP_001698589.1 predicted protein [Chlamydomonas reinhardtii]